MHIRSRETQLSAEYSQRATLHRQRLPTPFPRLLRIDTWEFRRSDESPKMSAPPAPTNTPKDVIGQNGAEYPPRSNLPAAGVG